MTLREAAEALVAKLAAVHDSPWYQRVWITAQLHDGPYVGPKYVDELDALRSALSAKEETAAPVEEYERFTRLTASFGCANPGSRGETCRDEYPDDADEWCLPCIAASILAPSSPQGPGEENAS